ncbi:MAG: N-acetyl sugar amidotransferase [Candidatus Margulisbacteria bacterium]|nr:N-acetyl sugar amidotransferase [Candidatus Margulisiibacteriota bacterium]
MELKRCTKCVLPETHETILFDENGTCNICSVQVTKQTGIDWDQRKKDLDKLVEAHRGKYDYDCLIPFSGGKDSTWTLYYLVKKYKLKPLVVRFDHGFLRDTVQDNSKRTFRQLGVDCLHFSPNWKVVQKLMLQSFLEKGDFCWHCHTGIFSYPMRVALQHQVPLIFWGEPSAEYTAYYSYDQTEEVDEKRFNRYVNLGINAEDMYIRLGGDIDKRDLKPYSYPPLKDLKKLNYRSVCLGSYIPWDVKKQSNIISKELGWKGDEVENVPEKYSYEKIECYMQGVRDYIKFIKRGYTRPSHLASIDIRHNRLSRADAVKMIRKYEGYRPPSLDLFLDFIGLTEEEFIQIAISHTVSPYNFKPESIKPGKKTHDFDHWEKSGIMNKKESQQQLSRWKARQKPSE